MPTRNINLTDRYDAFLSQQVAEGRFKNASEAVRAALHLLERHANEDEAKLETLRREARIGYDAFLAGEVTTIEGDDLTGLFPAIPGDVR